MHYYALLSSKIRKSEKVGTQMSTKNSDIHMSKQIKNINKDALEKIVSSLVENAKPLDGDISKMVDDNFWDLA